MHATLSIRFLDIFINLRTIHTTQHLLALQDVSHGDWVCTDSCRTIHQMLESSANCGLLEVTDASIPSGYSWELVRGNTEPLRPASASVLGILQVSEACFE